MDPIDATRDEIEERKERESRERRAARRRLEREADRKARELAATLDDREQALLLLLSDKAWKSIAELIDLTAECKAWRRRHDGTALSRDAHGKTLRRVLDALAAVKKVELKREAAANGEMMRFVRRLLWVDAVLSACPRGHAHPEPEKPCGTDTSADPVTVSTHILKQQGHSDAAPSVPPSPPSHADVRREVEKRAAVK